MCMVVQTGCGGGWMRMGKNPGTVGRPATGYFDDDVICAGGKVMREGCGSGMGNWGSGMRGNNCRTGGGKGSVFGMKGDCCGDF